MRATHSSPLSLIILGLLSACCLAVACAPPAPPAPAAATTPFFSTPGRYMVEGTGTARIKDLDLTSAFKLELLVDGSELTISRMILEVIDFDIIRHFLFIETANEKFRCTEVTNNGPMTGTVDSTGAIRIPPGPKMYGVTYEQRGAEPSDPCTGRLARFNGASDRDVTGLHEPGRDHFSLVGTFRTTYEGDDLPMSFTLNGHYRNRPPVARIGVEGPGYDLSQGGCPPLVGVNPPAAEANDPEGLRLTLVSAAYDPDGRERTHLVREDWVSWLGDPADPAAEYRFLGAGRRVGPVLFEFAPREHFLRLTARDNRRAEARSGCRFLVADTTPPVVSVPLVSAVACVTPAGATPATSQELAGILAGVSVHDRVDPEPEELPALLDGVEIDNDTLFKPGRNLITFRFRDRFGNLAEQGAAVDVGDADAGGCG